MVAANPRSPAESPAATVPPAELIPLSYVPRLVPREIAGRKVHRCTVYRWAQRGVAGVQLRTQSRHGVQCTAEAWLQDFFERLGWGRIELEHDGRDPATPAPATTPGHARREAARIDRELDREGW